jgi:hypothetical protein
VATAVAEGRERRGMAMAILNSPGHIPMLHKFKLLGDIGGGCACKYKGRDFMVHHRRRKAPSRCSDLS